MHPLRTPPLKIPPVLLTLDEARAMLRIGRGQFNELRDAGFIETVRMGRSVRVVANSVAQLPSRLRDMKASSAEAAQ